MGFKFVRSFGWVQQWQRVNMGPSCSFNGINSLLFHLKHLKKECLRRNLLQHNDQCSVWFILILTNRSEPKNVQMKIFTVAIFHRIDVIFLLKGWLGLKILKTFSEALKLKSENFERQNGTLVYVCTRGNVTLRTANFKNGKYSCLFGMFSVFNMVKGKVKT